MTTTTGRILTKDERDRARMSPIGLLSAATNGRFRAAPHQELMSFAGQLAVHASQHPELPSRHRNLIFAIPPRYGKTITGNGLAAWAIGNFAHTGYRVIAVGYGFDFAVTNLGYPVKNLLTDLGPSAFGIEIDPNRSSASSFGFIDARTKRVLDTSMVSTAPGSELLGLGLNLGIVDDITKNSMAAMSKTEQAKTWDWWQTTFNTRREPGASRILIGQRWSDNDLAARVMREEGLYDQGGAWTAYVMPLRATALDSRHIPGLTRPIPDYLGRVEGEYLWSDRYDDAYSAQLEREMDAHWFAAMYGQAPTIRDGIFQAEDQRYYTVIGDKYRLVMGVGPDEIVPIRACRRFMTCDLASSVSTRSDFSVFATWDMTPSGKTLLVGLQQGRYEGPRAMQVLETTWSVQEPKPAVVWMESDATQIGWVQTMRGRIPVRPFRSRDYGDKMGRGETAATVIAQGNLLLPQGAPMTRTVTESLWSFPYAPHDDVTDAVSMAAIVSLKSTGAMSGVGENAIRIIS